MLIAEALTLDCWTVNNDSEPKRDSPSGAQKLKAETKRKTAILFNARNRNSTESKICSDPSDCEKQKHNTQDIIDSSVWRTKTNNNPERICCSINISWFFVPFYQMNNLDSVFTSSVKPKYPASVMMSFGTRGYKLANRGGALLIVTPFYPIKNRAYFLGKNVCEYLIFGVWP